jgi:hypothetical protein
MNNNILSYNALLHKLIFVWEDMRFLTHTFEPEQQEYYLFDTIADKLMELHEILLKQMTAIDKASLDIDIYCMQIIIDIVYTSYILTELSTNQQVFQLYLRIQELHKALSLIQIY